MADWIKITDLAPGTSGGAAVAQDHFLNLDRVLAVSYREPAAHPGQAGPVAEVHVGEQQPIRLFSEGARDELRRALEERAGADARQAPPPAAWGRQWEASTGDEGRAATVTTAPPQPAQREGA